MRADFGHHHHPEIRLIWLCFAAEIKFPCPPPPACPQPMIFAGALYFGFVPRLVELIGWSSLSASVAAVQSSLWGLAYYGLLVFCMEFVPVGGINPHEVAEYLGLVRKGGMDLAFRAAQSASEQHIIFFSSRWSLAAREQGPTETLTSGVPPEACPPTRRAIRYLPQINVGIKDVGPPSY